MAESRAPGLRTQIILALAGLMALAFVPLFFAVAQRFLEEFATVSDARVVILRLADVQGMDASAAHALGDIVDHLERRGITVLLKGVRPEHLRVLEAVGSLDALAHEHHLFDDLPAAVAHARVHAARTPGPAPD